jgi:hypothetical protein
MPLKICHLNVGKSVPIKDLMDSQGSLFAVDQVRGMFDLKKEKTASSTFNVELQ